MPWNLEWSLLWGMNLQKTYVVVVSLGGWGSVEDSQVFVLFCFFSPNVYWGTLPKWCSTLKFGKKFSSEEFSGLCSFCWKNLPSLNEPFTAVQERLKWLTFFQQCKLYLLSVMLPAPCALHDWDNAPNRSHMCKLNPYKMLPSLLLSPQLVLNSSEKNYYYFRLF